MMKRKTLEEVRNEYGDSVVFAPIITDDALIDTIKAWYDGRKVCTIDPQKFILFFGRILRRDYGRYKELLRLEPGVSEYDWLVQTYKERQHTLDKATTDGHTTSYGKTNTKTYGHTVTNTAGQSNTRTYGNTDTSTLSGSDVDTLAKEGSITDKYGKEVTLDHGKVTTIGYTGYDVTTNDDTDTTKSNSSNAALAKTSPQSIIYNNNSAVVTKENMGGVTAHQGEIIKGLDFSFADSQSMSSANIGETVKREGENRTDFHSTDTYTNDGEDVTTNSGEDEREFDTTDTRTMEYGKVDTVRHTGTVVDAGSGSDTETYTGADTDTLSGQDTVEGVSLETDLNREIITGRQKEIAELLARACTYIVNTSAWSWLSEQLELAFYGVFDV